MSLYTDERTADVLEALYAAGRPELAKYVIELDKRITDLMVELSVTRDALQHHTGVRS